MDPIAVGAQLGVAAQAAARDLRRPTTRWWARIEGQTGRYGRWVPTGCVLREQAESYLEIVYPGRVVKEWRLL